MPVVEAIRLLHVHSEHGYTDRIDHAMRDEPEAVQASYQRQLTERAARSAADRQRDLVHGALGRMADELTTLGSAKLDSEVERDLRLVERTLAKIARRVG